MKRKIARILTATIATCVIAGGTAYAQYQVGSDGRAHDANNRLGSGGINEPSNRGPANVTGNQIVTGNVTGGREFRGAVPYTDPFAFRAPTAGIVSDRFIRNTAGVPIQGQAINNNASGVLPFYGLSQTVERPPGFVPEAPGTGFVAAPLVSREPGDLRLGRISDQPQIILPRPGQLVLPGPLDPSTQQPTVITASPLYGVRQWNFTEETDQQFLKGLNTTGTMRTRLDQGTLQRMRDELRQNQLQGEDQPSGEDAERDRTDRDGRTPRTGEPITPLESPENRALTETSRLDSRTSGEALASDVATGQRRGSRFNASLAARQDTQYAELRKRLDRYSRLPESMADIEANRKFQQELRQQQEREQAERASGDRRDPLAPGSDASQQQPQANQRTQQAQPGGRAPAGTAQPRDPSALRPSEPKRPTLEDLGIRDPSRRLREDPLTALPDEALMGTGGEAGREPPMQITSLATGVQAKGLNEILREAESLMKKEKFYSALDQYDLAEQVDPNNPMVPLGRAIAELGAAYYSRADQHLRDAFTKDPALLMARYDLKEMLGQQRLEELITDLRAISKTEANEPRSVFLLAFIDYNTGNPRRAAAYLDLAERRAGRPDPVFALLRKHWNLPAGEPAPDANK